MSPEPIVIQLDEEVIRGQIRKAVEAELDEFARRLRVAADIIDGYRFMAERDEFVEQRLQDAYANGVADESARHNRLLTGD